MSRGRDDEEAWQHLGLAVQLFIPARCDQFGQGVVRSRTGGVKLRRLNEDREVCEEWVSTTVIKMQVAVRHMRDVIEADSDCAKRGRQAVTARTVVSVDF